MHVNVKLKLSCNIYMYISCLAMVYFKCTIGKNATNQFSFHKIQFNILACLYSRSYTLTCGIKTELTHSQVSVF